MAQVNIPHQVLNGIMLPLPKNDIEAIPAERAIKDIHKKSINLI